MEGKKGENVDDKEIKVVSWPIQFRVTWCCTNRTQAMLLLKTKDMNFIPSSLSLVKPLRTLYPTVKRNLMESSTI